MWSNVQLSDGCPAPSSRSKHAMCTSQEGSIYLLGGRSANLPLKDIWRYDPVQSVWEELKCRGNRPPCLQEHTMVCWKNYIYVFGGEIGFASTGETPLWILDLTSLSWRKHHVRGSSVHQPSGRRGHTAVMFDGFMHVFGGYQDLRGSSSELWILDLGTERWSLLMTPSYFEQPPPRHNHSCIVHDGAMWIYGGLTDLQPRADFWKWDFDAHRWSRVKSQRGPGELHSHSAVQATGAMYVFGGEKAGGATDELWRFHFVSEVWERIATEGAVPLPRCRHVAVPAAPACEERAAPPPPPNLPPKSISMCFGQPPEGAKPRPPKSRVHHVSRFCSKNTSSDEDEDYEYSVAYNQGAAQVNLRTLRDKFHSSRLVRSISSGSYSILHNQHQQQQARCKAEELEKLVEEKGGRPRLKIQKSQSSDAVLESDGESTPKKKPAADSPPLWVENPNTLLRASWSESTFRQQQTPSCAAPIAAARPARLAYDGLLATVRDVIEENSESADEPNLMANNENANPNCREALLVDLGETTGAGSNPFRSSHTISDLASHSFQATPSLESRGLPHSVSHSSGYHSFTDEDNNGGPEHCHREFAGCLNSGNGPAAGARRKKLPRGRDLELKTFSPGDDQQQQQVLLPPPPPCKQRARSLDRTSQRKLVRSYPSGGGSITPTVLMSTAEDSFATRKAAAPKATAPSPTSRKGEEEESPLSPVSHWSQGGDPHSGRARLERHEWQLCLYMFGGREQGAPGVYRQPISIWKLYV